MPCTIVSTPRTGAETRSTNGAVKSIHAHAGRPQCIEIELAQKHQRKAENNKQGVRYASLPDLCLVRRAHWRKAFLGADQDIPEGTELLKAAPGAERDAGQRIIGNRDWQTGCVTEHAVDVAQQRAAAGHHNALFDNVRGKFRRRLFQRHLHTIDDLPDRVGNGFGNLGLGDGDFLRHAIHKVAAADLDLDARALLGLAGDADVLLYPLGAGLADEQVMRRRI